MIYSTITMIIMNLMIGTLASEEKCLRTIFMDEVMLQRNLNSHVIFHQKRPCGNGVEKSGIEKFFLGDIGRLYGMRVESTIIVCIYVCSPPIYDNLMRVFPILYIRRQ